MKTSLVISCFLLVVSSLCDVDANTEHKRTRFARQVMLGGLGSGLSSRLSGISSGYGYGYNNAVGMAGLGAGAATQTGLGFPPLGYGAVGALPLVGGIAPLAGVGAIPIAPMGLARNLDNRQYAAQPSFAAVPVASAAIPVSTANAYGRNLDQSQQAAIVAAPVAAPVSSASVPMYAYGRSFEEPSRVAFSGSSAPLTEGSSQTAGAIPSNFFPQH